MPNESIIPPSLLPVIPNVVASETNVLVSFEVHETPKSASECAALVYLARLASAGSRRTMRGHLERMAGLLTQNRIDAQSLPWGELRYQHTQALRSALTEKLEPATVNLALSALRGVLREAWRLGQMTAEECERACDLKPVKSEKLPAGKALAGCDLRALLDGCSGESLCDIRDYALLGILYGCGLRRAEAVALDVGDYDAGEGSLRVRCGKGQKERICYLNDGAAAALDRYISAAEVSEGPLFRSISKSGRVLARRLSGQGVYVILEGRAKAAGIGDVKPHDMRRTFCSDLLDAGVDLGTASKMMGHASVQTTMRYDKRGDRAKKAAANLLKI